MTCIIAFTILSGCSKDSGSASTPAKTTGHVYATIEYDNQAENKHNFYVEFYQDGSGTLAKKTATGNGTLDFGEWNPGTYFLAGNVDIKDSSWIQDPSHSGGGYYIYPPKYVSSKKSFQVQANADSKIVLDNWH